MALTTEARKRLVVALANKRSAVEVADAIDNVDVSADIQLQDAVDVSFGTGDDALMRWSTGDASNHALVMALGDSNQALHVTDKAAVATDWNVSADTHPTVYVHSNTTPATDYMTFGAHDGTIGHINVVGGTTLSLDIAGTAGVTMTATALTLADAMDIVVNATTGTKIGTATTQKLGFFNATPAVQPSAYTQTYATANKTHANPTAAALTVTDGAGTNDGTIGAITDNASTITAVQELADQINKLVADVADVKQLANSVIDDLQALGLVG